MKRETTEELEDLLKERSDQYLLYPSDRVWSNISKELHPNRGWLHVSLFLLSFLAITTTVMIIKQKTDSLLPAGASTPFTAYRFLDALPSEKLIAGSSFKTMVSAAPENLYPAPTEERPVQLIQAVTNADHQEDEERKALVVPFNNDMSSVRVSLDKVIPALASTPAVRKNNLEQTIDNILEQARKISKNARWQFYVTPTIGYRRLEGEASSLTFQYSSYSLSTNAMFARDVNDAVSHRPGMGFEAGAAMYYPLTKRLSLKAGLQANYNHYQIDAYRSVPEIANYGVNNLSFGGIPISAVSSFTTSSGFSRATLRNEHYMLSIPVGVDYRVTGNEKLNFSMATTLQPTYVFANYSYLISTNLRNYAKEPTLNRHWNVNAAVEANLNIDKGGYKWSIGPQFRYQLMSSFKNKYPISEHLMDFGIKVGVIKTIK